VRKELLAAEQLKIRVLEPTVAQGLVAEIVHVLEDGEAGHKPGRQRRAASSIRWSEFLSKKSRNFFGIRFN